MADLDAKKIQKLKKGELAGTVATVFCAVVVALFIALYTVANTQNMESLELACLIAAPILIAGGAAVAAACNIKFGGEIDRMIKNYVRDVCIESAAQMHPERNSLTFYISLDDSAVYLQVNGYKDKIAFDFECFGKLSLTRKISVLTAIEDRLSATFCKLWERGAKYAEVCFAEREGTRRKSGKTVYIIKNSAPEPKTYKNYLKNKRSV